MKNKHYLREIQEQHRKAQQTAPIQLGHVRALAADGKQVMASAQFMLRMSDTAFKEAYENDNFKILGTEHALKKVKERAMELGVHRTFVK